MPKILSETAITQYKQDGFYYPLPVLDAQEVAACRGELESFEASRGEPIGGALRNSLANLKQGNA